jgi:hypothetical protein
MVLSNSGGWVSLTFTTFLTEPGYDFVYLFNGPSVRAPLIGQYSGQELQGLTIGCKEGVRLCNA